MTMKALLDAWLRGTRPSERSCKTLEIVIDASGTKVWINADGECAGRWYDISRLYIDDRRGYHPG